MSVQVMTLNRLNAERFPFLLVTVVKSFILPAWVRGRRIAENYGITFGYKNPFIKKSIIHAVRDFNPDIIHCHYGPVGIQFVENIGASQIPILISFHGFDASQRLKSGPYCGKLKKILNKPFVSPIFVSRDMERRVRESTGWMDGRSHILYYGIQTSHFVRRSRAHLKRPCRFVQISNFTEKKGHQYTLRAFANMILKIGNRNVELVLAGEGYFLDSTKELAKDLGISDVVRFTGLVNHDEALDLLEGSHVFVHHSVTAGNGDMEGVPNAIMEAMAMELPILSTVHSGIPELVEHGVNGLLVAERDVDSYTKQMIEMLDWQYLLINRDKIKEQFDLEVHANRLEMIYKIELSAMGL